MGSQAVSALGWVATTVFVASYFCSRPGRLRAVQMGGAILWVTYGIVIHAAPVIVANLLVFGAAAWTTFRARRAATEPVEAATLEPSA